MATQPGTALEKSSLESLYQLDTSQVLKASNALLKHIKSEALRKEKEASKKNVLAGGSDSSQDEDGEWTSEPIWLVLTTKTHIVDKKRLKPSKILLPHNLNRPNSTSVLLITPDPQRSFKDILSRPAFPSALASQIRVLGLSKLRARYKSFESRRQLLSEHDVFLADERIIVYLSQLLGKTVYESSKRPVPVRLEAFKPHEQLGNKRKKGGDAPKTPSVGTPEALAREIERALSSAHIKLSPSVTTSVRVGFSNFPAEHLVENVEAVVAAMVDRFVTKGWRNVRAIHIKGPNTMALPIWHADELWVDENHVLETEKALELPQAEQEHGKKRKRLRDGDINANGAEQDNGAPKKKAKKTRIKEDEGKANKAEKDLVESKELLRRQKKEAMDAVTKKSSAKMATTPVEGKAKSKKKKIQVAAAS